ncbi:hypothetical protein J2R76_005800 [Bradyrhizobium sp. USDA 4532]|uniref:hypothetical protein n=1 Tax=unclassified Bradyrhizobium TaxID=2631580 RepID=UPI00209D21BB|nr:MULTISPECIES: hypothetical protein [unclassified Bradyrhizobium]MCP1829100.1 hypothetical protein [Bradyrhizobium sp. USDA 4545]MCP1922209.1 hypothetical protein [Bradyrhizobium sp. USDA 4532]
MDTTRFVYRGFLFGHYDSRGGTMFVEAGTEDQALRHYALTLGCEPSELGEELLRELHDGDFLCEAMIESADLIEVGADLDGATTGSFDLETGEGVTAWIVGRNGNPEFWLDCLPTDGSPLRIWYGTKPAEISFAPRWDDDAYGLLFYSAGTR